ncbi:MAG: hypothetical protein EP344_05390 [Bacteroidetes bacterium]|nr:MAG: hypothetical protein EP344_05390 [Bacteroidota bacterium]
MRIAVVFLVLLATGLACRPEPPERIPLPTEICLTTSHHNFPIPHATIYLKYNVDTFPGYDQPPGYFDATFQTGSNARGCIQAVPEGRHWAIGFGYDSLHYPHNVFGSLRLEIALGARAKIDTTMYVSEEH